MGLVNKARAKATLAIMARGSVIPDEHIPAIPQAWETFPGTNDKWCAVNFPVSENTTACIYKAQEGSVFPPHKHPKRVEHFAITNPGGHVKVITETRIYELKYPQSTSFEIGEVHAVKFITQTDLIVMWHPRMDQGFDTDFLNEKDINLTPA